MPSIVIVDDRPQDLDLLATILRYANHEVLPAANGAEALDLTRRHRPDLVITDLVMPVMDGYEFVRRLRADPDLNRTEVLFYSATYLDARAKAMAEQWGVHCILTKPVEPQALIDTVQSLLGLDPVVPQSTWELPAPGPLDRIRQTPPIHTERLQAMNSRLAALLALSLELTAEHDIERLLRAHCRAGRKILAVQYVGVGRLNPETKELESFVVDGVDAGIASGFARVAGGLLVDAALDGRARRTQIPSEVPSAAGLPPGHPPVHSLMVIPVRGEYISGVLYLANKLADGGFSEDDELIAATLAAKMRLRCENASLFAEVQSRRDELEKEARQRNIAEEEIQRLNGELIQKVKLLSMSNADLEQFAYSASHDLKEPLRSVDSYAQLLVRRFADSASAEAREFAVFIHDGAERMRTLLDGLLAYSRVAQSIAEPESVDAGGVLGETLANLRQTILETHAVVEESPLPSVRMNRTQLLQIFMNLVGNALKYSPQGVPPRVEISATLEDRMVQFAVADHGLGIPPNFHQKVFELFRRVHGEEYEGVGIGLAICKRLVERNGGRIWLESQPGSGSTFYFTLPAAKASRVQSA